MMQSSSSSTSSTQSSPLLSVNHQENGIQAGTNSMDVHQPNQSQPNSIQPNGNQMNANANDGNSYNANDGNSYNAKQIMNSYNTNQFNNNQPPNMQPSLHQPILNPLNVNQQTNTQTNNKPLFQIPQTNNPPLSPPSEINSSINQTPLSSLLPTPSPSLPDRSQPLDPLLDPSSHFDPLGHRSSQPHFPHHRILPLLPLHRNPRTVSFAPPSNLESCCRYRSAKRRRWRENRFPSHRWGTTVWCTTHTVIAGDATGITVT